MNPESANRRSTGNCTTDLFLMVCLVSFMVAQAGPAFSSELPAVVAPPSDELRTEFQLDSFYKKCLVVDELPIVSSDQVYDAALFEAADIVRRMLAGRDDLLRALARNKVRVAIMAPNEFTTDIPEHADLRPAKYWNRRARGLGATK